MDTAFSRKGVNPRAAVPGTITSPSALAARGSGNPATGGYPAKGDRHEPRRPAHVWHISTERSIGSGVHGMTLDGKKEYVCTRDNPGINLHM